MQGKLNIKQFADKCGVTPATLRNWERSGKITSERTKGNHRRYDINELCKIKPPEKYYIGYARVSTRNKKDDLERQKQVIELYCASKGYSYKIIEDIGSGLNYNKKGLLHLIDLIQSDFVEGIVITHKDRLLRFGAEIIFKLCEKHNARVEIINRDDEKTDCNKELVDDVLSIITVFSAKLYGRRSRKNQKIIESNNRFFNEETTSAEKDN